MAVTVPFQEESGSTPAAFYPKIPVGHVEAGLRTGNMHAPWPEDANRRVAGVLAPVYEAGRNHESRHAWYRFYVFVQPELLAAGHDRDGIVRALIDQGLPTFHGSCSEIYREKAFAGGGCEPASRLPNAGQLGETSMMLLTHPGVHKVDVDLDVFRGRPG